MYLHLQLISISPICSKNTCCALVRSYATLCRYDWTFSTSTRRVAVASPAVAAVARSSFKAQRSAQLRARCQWKKAACS